MSKNPAPLKDEDEVASFGVPAANPGRVLLRAGATEPLTRRARP